MKLVSMKTNLIPSDENIKNEYLTADMTGQKIFIGIDMHDKQWTITLRHDRRTLQKVAINPNAKTLSIFLARRYPGADCYSAYEAGYFGFKPHRDLWKEGISNIVLNPADIPTTDKERSNKNDKWDSLKMAKHLEAGHLTGIYVPTERDIALRSVIRHRKQLVYDRTRVKNRIKGFLRSVGIDASIIRGKKSWTKKYIASLEAIKFKEPANKFTLTSLLEDLDFLTEKIKKVDIYLDEVLLTGGESAKIINRLLKLPGIGDVTAKTLYLELIDIERFKGRKALVSYVGFAPGMHQSGEKDHTLGISKRHNKFLRTILIEAAWIAIKKGKYLEKYNKLIDSMKKNKNKVIIRIAKMLLLDVRREWLLALREMDPVKVN